MNKRIISWYQQLAEPQLFLVNMIIAFGFIGIFEAIIYGIFRFIGVI